ncbi:copper resistance system multicopper oxidase [Methylophaga sp. OBS4]|uniref:copper resistance system multicopper oxidase n=1 Tax=Methylophaga sp. OBS4 TaxID=2991935 RepID=UPI002255690F|nr:copper resistance system multicopper oxidase [Methylophaga sp. OBS4]MCX4186934.1 copper resistance system multicopper oxidase [Methylophaga sp. OBS4]
MKHTFLLPLSVNPARRKFVQGLVAGGTVLGLAPLFNKSLAAEIPATSVGTSQQLAGKEFDLTVAQTLVNFTGKPRMATTINGSIPAPTLRWKEGDTITLRVTNRLPVSTSIHWHGIILPYQMDGVPGISFPGIAPGTTFTYKFKVKQSGTYWYHSHTAFQEQTGMYGAIIIDPAEGEDTRADRDYVVQLSDWTDEDPMDVFAKLKKQSDYYNFNQPTVADFFEDVSGQGLTAAVKQRRMWNRMRMSPTDLADLSGYTYTYLMNGMPPAANWTGLFRRGERVRLRFIGSGTQTFFDVRIPGLKMTVVQVDGQNIEPVTVDEFRFGSGETYDVVVQPSDDRAYTIFAQTIGRSGYARGTLTPNPGMTAEIPEVDTPEWLTMADMMGAMMHDGMNMPANEHSMHGAQSAIQVNHAKTEYGPSVDMRVDTPRINLDDPGIGLRNNGRHVLTYADIHTIGGALEQRQPEREIELHLTGNMERYTWSLDGLEFGKSTPVHFNHNERLRVILHNDTMMTHPMHLHGMWSELQNPDGHLQALRHTISVQPAQRISFLVTANALGRWAWHCHLLYHMEAGMFREVVVD